MDQGILQKIGKYEILAELGQGGTGVVYKARDPFIGRFVALRTITPELVSDPEILKHFYAEAQSAAALQHRNLAAIYDVGEADGRSFVAMEFVQGENLQSIIDLRVPVPLAAKLKLVQQICEGLGYAHKNGMVHRGVRPANLVVTNDGVVKVLEFGIAHLESANLSKVGRMLGTLNYASPEQINDGFVDSRSDIWAVAAVFYEFIAYKKAFDGSNIAATIAKIFTANPEPISVCCPAVPAELDRIIGKGLAKSQEERYSTLDEMLEDLLPIARGLQQSFISELLVEARSLRDQGSIHGAQQKVRAILILDHTHAEGNRLYSEITSQLERQTAADTGEDDVSKGEVRLKEALSQADHLVSAGKYDEANDHVLALQQEFPSSDEIRLKLKTLEPLVRSANFIKGGKNAFEQGEFGEAVRAFTAALELNPQNKEALELKARAVQERDRLRQVREAFAAGQRAMRQGDSATAALELEKVLQLDPKHAQGNSLLGQIRQTQAAREREAKIREGLQQADNLVAEKKIEEAQFALLELQQGYPESTEIDQKLRALEQGMKLHLLVADGEQAFNQREFGEAVRILTEALVLAPTDDRLRDLKVRAVQERDRLRQVREAIAGGQRAQRQGQRDVAEQQFQRALQLDPANSRATRLLIEVQTELPSRDREQSLKAGLSRAETLISLKKFDEAERQLTELQQAYPKAEALQPMFKVLSQRRAEAAAMPPTQPPIATPPAERPAVRPAPASDYAKSMELAEELRQSLQKLKLPGLNRPAKRPPPASPPPEAGAQPSGQGRAVGTPPIKPPGEENNVTLLRGAAFNSYAAPAGQVDPNLTMPRQMPTPSPTAARRPVVTLISSGDLQPWSGPIQRGQMVPDNSVEGGLKSISLAIPPIADAPANAEVIIVVSIDANGNVTPIRMTADDFGLASRVMAAAKAWKFSPPTVKGTPVSTTLQVKVVF
jgi:eukaryotic-like serine/threonine-protein kinase